MKKMRGRTAAAVRERRAPAATVTVTATEAQNEFGRVLDQAAHDHVVVITRHEAPRAVLLSFERYQDLVGTEASVLDTLAGEFDALLEAMQRPEVRSATGRGFHARPKEMGRAAVRQARRGRGK